MKKLLLGVMLLLAIALLIGGAEAKSYYAARLEAAKAKTPAAGTAEVSTAGTDAATPDAAGTGTATSMTNLAGLAVKDSYTVKEKVLCLFQDSQMKQKCYSALGKCEGLKQCSVNIATKDDRKGTVLTWKSTCPGEYMTTVDGKDETVTFSCATACIKGEFRLTQLKDGHYYGAEKCNAKGKWLAVAG